MKLHRLELEGFGPFRDRQTVDFDAFDAEGLFLISGRTGAGKSSILDGVCYALYGTAPRYDGSDRGLRSDHSDPDQPTEARLEFTAGGRRWRVTRAPEYERPKARGEGTTTQKSAVLVEQAVGGGWLARTTKHREAGDLLDEILGLNRDQFQQVILLAQNRFAEFLLAKNDDRQALLRTLFGTRRYEEYEAEFEGRRRAAQQSLDADAAILSAHLSSAERIIAASDLGGASTVPDAASPTTAMRLEALQRAVPRAQYRAEESERRSAEAEAAHDDALTAYGALVELRKKQEERLASRRALTELEADAAATSEDRGTLDRARAAEALRSSIVDAERSRAAATRSAEIERVARAAWIAAGQQAASPDALRAMADEIAGDLAIWAHAVELEHALPALEAARDRAGAEATSRERRIAELDERRAARAVQLGELEPQIAEAERTAQPVEPARESLDSAATRLAAGREAEHLAARSQQAEAAQLKAVADLESASTTVRRLLERRLAGFASELAGELADGEPCPVCGAVEHPHPARAASDPVTDEAIVAAEEAVERAHRAAANASDAARDSRAAHQSAWARAGGEDLARLEGEHAAAESRLAAAIAAAEAITRLKLEQRDLRAADSAATVERDSQSARLAVALQNRAASAQEADAALAAIDAARGAHASVGDRVDAARRRRELARALADAVDDLTRCESAAADSEAARDERLKGSAFADAADAAAALLDVAAQAVLEERVRAYEVAYTTERNRLFDLETELAGAPEEPVELDPAAATAARERWNLAVAAAARDAAVATQLTDAADRACAASAASAARAGEYEVIAALANAVAGRSDSRMDLETFVLAAELEEIVDAANLRLDAMSSGRYQLQHTDAVGARKVASGLGIAVLDAYTGQARPAQSLSGGETFLASLALALGLAEVVTARSGGVRLDTLFIDEGFGSLDDETLDLAMRTLDELRQGGRTVGLISHVATMKEQLPAQLIVETTPQGPSIIRQSVLAPRHIA